jgi:hypothetical protein
MLVEVETYSCFKTEGLMEFVQELELKAEYQVN